MIKPKNLLIVRTDRLGDVVLSLPLARVVKENFPNCKITFLVRNYTKDLLYNHPFIDDIIILKEESNKILIKENISIIKKYGFDTSIIVYPTFQTALIIFLSKIKYRIGTGYRWYSFLFNKRMYEHRKFAEKHELEFNINLLKIFGIKKDIDKENVKFDLIVDETAKEKIEEKLNNNVKPGNKIIVIHPGSGGSSVDLPIEKFKVLIKLLKEIPEIQIILTGAKSEIELCNELKLYDGIINLAGKLELKGLIALIDRSKIFIANSTGPIHIAAALNKFTIGFYPKILACSPQRWGPYSSKSFVFMPKIDCESCTTEQCAELNCMNSIAMDEVLVEIKKMLKNSENNGDLNVE